MTTNSRFVRSLQFMFPVGQSRRSHRASRRNKVTSSLSSVAEVVEERCLLSVSSAWVAQGPGPTINAQVAIPANDPVNGAIHTIAAHPTNADIVYVGTVNGGVWKTTNATTSNTWTPLTDTLQSQSIGAIEFDLTDPTFNTLLSGTGRWSNYASIGDDSGMLYYTTNGGTSWTVFSPAVLADQEISAVAARGNAWLVTTTSGGVYRSTNRGATFTNINGLNGLGTGGTQDMAADPTNSNRFYVSMQSSGGIFRTDDAGATWTDVTGTVAGVSGASRVRLAVNASAGAVYVAVGAGGAGAATKVWRSANQGGVWTQMDDVFVHNGGQQNPNTSLAADPTNANLVYVGGDRIQNGPFTGLSSRGDATATAGSQWTILVDGGATNTAPHADTRDMAFRADGSLLESDDGGMYRHTNPSGTGSWVAAAGNIAAVEAHNVAYNSLNNTLVIGTQDNGTHLQPTSGNTQWTFINGGDGGDVAVDSFTLAGSNQSIVYLSSQNLRGFRRVVYDNNNNFVSSTSLAGITLPNFTTPIELNSINPLRLLIGGANALFESTDQGTTNTSIGGPGQPGFVQNAMVYGGSLAGTPNPDLIYIGADSTVYKRTTSGGAITATTALPAGAGQVNDVAIVPDNYNTVFATDNNQVFMSSNGGTSWSDITGNLGSLSSINEIRTVVYVAGPTPYVAVGTRSGVFASPASSFGTWVKLGTTLPDVLIFDLVYNVADDVLVAGTFGRGVWTLPNASLLLDPTPTTPTMIGPVGTFTNPVPLFEWSVGANADHYELAVDNLTKNITNYYTQNVVTTSHLAVSQFIEGDYQSRVRTVTATGKFSTWSNFVKFTIDIPTPAKPTIIRPSGDITDSFPKFEWTGDAFSSNYSLWVSNAATQARVIYRTEYDGTSYVHFNPLPDGTYHAWVRAFNAVGEYSPWSDFVKFTIDAPIPVAPVITAPTPVTSDTSPRIVWNAVNGAASYDLWVNSLTTGQAQIIRRSDISYKTPYFDAPTLPQGSYTAWVRAANGNSEFSQWSKPYSFTFDILPPATPKMLEPTGALGSQTITTTNPTFKWTAAAGAVKYDLWVNNVTTGQAQIIREQNITGTQYVALTNLPQGNYRAWVRGINRANEVGDWSTVHIFNLDEATPSIPVITAPIPNPAGSVENPNPTFAWRADFDAPLYEFRLDDQTLNKTNVVRVSNIQAKSYTIPNNQRLAEHTYVAMVRAVNNSGEMSDWSAPYRVRIDVPNPTTPSIVGPTGTSKDRTPTFEWNHDSGSLRYEILVRDLERAETIVLQVTAFSLDPTGKIAFYTLPDNKAFQPGTYRFWIRAFNSVGTSSGWSNSKTFVISASLDLKNLKIVEPAKLESAEAFYAAAQHYVQPDSDTTEAVTIEAPAIMVAVTELVLPPVADVAISETAIEELMESLANPSSAASSMLSGVWFDAHVTESKPDGTPTAAASLLALAMMPVRRKRREE